MATVFLVDDDDAVRSAIRLLLRSVGLAVEIYASAPEFLAAYDPARPGCLVLDMRMPGMSGLELQEALAARHSILPIVFVTGHADVPMAVRAIQSGAIDFIEKPFSDQVLIERVQRALALDERNRAALVQREAIAERITRLTPREREVMRRIVDGQANKVVAIELGLSERTVEIHRARVMEKMCAPSLAHLVRQVVALGTEGPAT